MSQNHSETKHIDGHEYEVFMLSPMTSIKLLTRMAKMLGPGIGPIVDAVSKGGGFEQVMDQDLGDAFFSQAAEALFTRLDEDLIENVIYTMADNTMVGGKKLRPIFDVHFKGQLGTITKWLGFALKVQYQNFWSALGENLPQGSPIQLQQ